MREIPRQFTERTLRGFLFKSKLHSLLLLTGILIVILGSFFIGMTLTRVTSNCQVTYTVTSLWVASNPVPTGLTVNGHSCGQETAATPGSTTPLSTPSPGTHVDNPYAGAQGYINPDWAAEVKAGAASIGGSLGAKEAKVAQYSTAVWLDRIAAVTGGSGITRSLVGHLDAAEQQARTSSKPIVITLVIYDLPDRDCAALASNGELSIANHGLATYETRYIDVIAATLSRAKYRNLRISTVIEPDSLPNLVTNLGIGHCAEANSSGVYVQGIQYALNKLHGIPNVYNYLDIAHDGWLGWTTNFQAVVALITRTIQGTTAGLTSVDGFISNTANYTPTTEPFMTANQSVGGSQVRNASFYESNTYIDEATYDTDMRQAFISAGFPSSIGMLIDTSRNGWGGPARPAGPGSSTNLNTFVNATRIDRRLSRGNWCNQPSGIGARPAANPAPGFDAYVWIKPPGESDGASQAIANTQGKNFDRMCDPTYTGNMMNNFSLTGSMPNAPLAGQWFQTGFNTLVENANPSF